MRSSFWVADSDTADPLVVYVVTLALLSLLLPAELLLVALLAALPLAVAVTLELLSLLLPTELLAVTVTLLVAAAVLVAVLFVAALLVAVAPTAGPLTAAVETLRVLAAAATGTAGAPLALEVFRTVTGATDAFSDL